VGSWVAFGVAAIWYPDALTDVWQWGQSLPLVAEIALWIATLPWMLALAVLESAWPDWLQVTIIAVLAAAWMLFSAPRPPKGPAPKAAVEA
jgi:hypothetical protein